MKPHVEALSVSALDGPVNIASLCVGVAGAALAYVFYRRSMREKRLVFGWMSKSVVDPGDSPTDGLQIVFAGAPVARVSRTMICVWNGGRETVDERDVVTEHPVAFAIREDGNPVPILRSKVAAASRGDIGLEVKPGVDANTGVVAFSFLDGGDGALIEVLHCGSPDCVVDFSGTIKGAPWGVQPVGKTGNLPVSCRSARVVGWVLVSWSALLALLLALTLRSGNTRFSTLLTSSGDPGDLVVGVLLGAGGFLFVAARIVPWLVRETRVVPPSLRAHLE